MIPPPPPPPGIPVCSKCGLKIVGSPRTKTMDNGMVMYLCNSCYTREVTTGT